MTQQEKQEKSWEEFVSSGLEARESKDGSQWVLGDLASEVSTEYGDDTIGKYAYAIGVEKKTLMNYRTVSSFYKKKIREKYKKLSFSHFSILTTTEKPEAWLEKADDENWNVETLRTEMRKAYEDTGPDLEEKPPKSYKCPECGRWRLKGVSSHDICRGHYKIEKGKINYV